MKMNDHFQNRLKTVYLRCGFRVYKETCQIEIKNDRRICNASIPTVLNIPDMTRSNSLRSGCAFISNSKWRQIVRSELYHSLFPVSNLNTNTTFISKLRKIHRSPRIFKPGGSVSRVCTKLAQLGPVAIVAESSGGGEEQKARLAHSTINRNDRP